ncbi:phage major capsid protein [Gordonia polyisoprenivorans]|uniref:phage major capsid protein n=1 Tax=Gordonia polyisoprenivorans TaxID=84595 RepID=UPI0013FD1BA2|nr:phage major capsid protein [Gordonia polyisoprenivorans]QUD81035.1 phage major capsid protein [Gordonia polyisoprenivorans]
MNFSAEIERATGPAAFERIGRELAAEADRIAGDRTVTKAAKTAQVKVLNGHMDALDERVKNHQRAAEMRAKMGNPGGSAVPEGHAATKSIVGSLPSPFGLSDADWRDAFDSATRRKAFRAVATKAATTISLPGVVDPGLTQTLAAEPDRLLDHLPSQAIDAPSIEYVCHTGNTNPAGVVAELGTKPDLGMQLTMRTATATKIAALASASMEALSDFDTFRTFIPGELQRAVVDAETGWAVAQFEGISGVLTRAKGSTESPIDTLAGAFNDLRVGNAYATANLVAMHPSTWLYLQSQKDSYGRYLLGEPGSVTTPSIWGVPVIRNTKIATGTALVFDTSCARVWHRMGLTIDSDMGFSGTNFSSNAVTYRCEERVAVGLLRPAGLNIVTGLAAS